MANSTNLRLEINGYNKYIGVKPVNIFTRIITELQSPVSESRSWLQSPLSESRSWLQSPVIESRSWLQSPVIESRSWLQSPPTLSLILDR